MCVCYIECVCVCVCVHVWGGGFNYNLLEREPDLDGLGTFGQVLGGIQNRFLQFQPVLIPGWRESEHVSIYVMCVHKCVRE